MGRRFILSEGTSNKFWEIDVDGATTVVRFGRMGTVGQQQAKEHASAEAASAAAAKLITEKVRKGYTEEAASVPSASSIPSAPSVPSGRAVVVPPPGLAEGQNLGVFCGVPVAAYQPGEGLADAGGRAWRLSRDYDDEAPFLETRLHPFLAEPDVGMVTALVIGAIGEPDQTSQEVIEELVEYAHLLPSLRGLFLCDVTSEECEVSWIHHGDVTLPLEAFPNLEVYGVRGGSEEITIRTFRHAKLRTLTFESGGLPSAVVRAVAASQMPALEHLELWLGTSDYSGDATVADLQPILEGRSLPNLRYLGLRDAEIADEVAAALASAPVVAGLELLDLSLGSLTDTGARALLAGQPLRHLSLLDLHHHYLSDTAMAELQASGIRVDVRDRQEPDSYGDEEHRYVAVGE